MATTPITNEFPIIGWVLITEDAVLEFETAEEAAEYGCEFGGWIAPIVATS